MWKSKASNMQSTQQPLMSVRVKLKQIVDDQNSLYHPMSSRINLEVPLVSKSKLLK